MYERDDCDLAFFTRQSAGIRFYNLLSSAGFSEGSLPILLMRRTWCSLSDSARGSVSGLAGKHLPIALSWSSRRRLPNF